MYVLLQCRTGVCCFCFCFLSLCRRRRRAGCFAVLVMYRVYACRKQHQHAAAVRVFLSANAFGKARRATGVDRVIDAAIGCVG